MRDLFITWCTEVGCTVTVDRVGNIFARRPGDGRPPAAGADGQPPRHPVRGRQVRRHRRRAGRPRGAPHARRPARAHQAAARAGVLDQRGGRALHARRWWPRAPSRASSTWTGCSPCATTTASSSGASSSASATTARPRWAAAAIDAYFELHIEQGPILDREAMPVGIVVGGYATRGHARGRPRRDRARGAHPDGPAAQRAGGRGDARGRGQRRRLEVPRHRGQGHGGPPDRVAEQGRHPLRVRPAHLRRAPRRPRGGRPDVGGGEGGDPRLRAARQRGDAHRGGVAVRQRALRSRAASG